MEGLIPFVIHAIKKSREKSGYRCLSNGSHGGARKPLIGEWDSADEGSSHHRRTRSEFPPIGSDFFSPEQRMAPSRSLREDPSSVGNFSTITRANKRK
ncbi:hypothetical protein LUZ63_005976 [Rhynchospora breviuscula]|uniref:Uncharacterized protein n=1 Tax=Rhynchospora breviuscula TaxID=2022672 RepID=A0A9Q0CNW4_9POAL|nr:hypothetical protein LUZ63_005976 [Rhynchospora breviuscula]